VRLRKDLQPVVRNYPSRSSREPRHCSTSALDGNSRLDLQSTSFFVVLPCFACCVFTITVIPKHTAFENIAVFKTSIPLLRIVEVKGYRFVVQKLHYTTRRSIREVIEYYVEINIDGCIREECKNPGVTSPWRLNFVR
jgi:hypothetical protein